MRRTSWELPEIVAGSILVAFSALAVGGVASGIAAAASNSNEFPGGESAAQILAQATGWAGPFEAFMVVAALFVIWWQADSWSGVLEQYELEQYEDETDEAPVFDEAAELDEAPDLDEGWEEAVKHLLRGRALALWVGSLTGVIAAGAIVLTISDDIVQGYGNGFVWPLRISTFGDLVATLVLCAAGILGAIRVHRLCSAQLLTEEEELEDEEGLENEEEEAEI